MYQQRFEAQYLKSEIDKFSTQATSLSLKPDEDNLIKMLNFTCVV